MDINVQKKTTSAKRDVNNKLCVFIKGIKPPHRQISVMPISAHSLRMSSGQMLACISPICALCSITMHRRLWPMPPPMDNGSLSSRSCLWKYSFSRSCFSYISSCLSRLSLSTRMPIELSSNERPKTGYQIRMSPLRPFFPFSATVDQSS